MPEEEFYTAFQRILSGEQVNERIGPWRLSNLNGVKLIELFYQDGAAIYSFQVNADESSLVLWNSHREAMHGKGTESLQNLEKAIASVASRLIKSTRLIFPKFAQEDTAEWLEKSGYSYNAATDEYEKEIL